MASTKSGRSMLTTIQFNDNLNKKLHRMINSIPPQALKMPSIRGNYVYDGWWTVITFIEPFSYRRPYQTCVSHILFFFVAVVVHLIGCVLSNSDIFMYLRVNCLLLVSEEEKNRFWNFKTEHSYCKCNWIISMEAKPVTKRASEKTICVMQKITN